MKKPLTNYSFEEPNWLFKKSPKERFMAKVMPEPNTGCWIWIGGIGPRGYGSIGIEKETITAHRFSYLLHKGEITDNLHVLHHCDNKWCVNPDHLFLGTPLDNMQDYLSKGFKIICRIGESHHMTKTTNEQVLEIRELSKQGLTKRKIATMYNISESSAGRIVNRITWRHI